MTSFRIVWKNLAVTAVIMGALTGAESYYGKLPLQFEPNQGQADSKIKFLAHGPGYTLLLTANEAWMPGGIRMAFAGANASAAVQGLDLLPGKVNYLRGNDPAKWHTNIATFAKVKYGQVYPGVDLLYYGKAGRLEYDLILAPGADASPIRFRLDGAKARLDKDGDIVLKTGRDEVRLCRPAVYQMNGNGRERIAGAFLLDRNEVRFKLGRYDRSRELIIDPVVVYASYLGGNENTYINGIAVNAAGQLYLTGRTFTTNFPVTSGALQPANATNPSQNTVYADAFVSKISTDGTRLIYSTYLGGNNDDVGRAIAVDRNDNAYVTGYTQSNNFPVTVDAIQSQCGQGVATSAPGSLNPQYLATTANCAPDVFLTKLNPSGQLLYSTFLGGTGNDSPTAIGLDPIGNVYIGGSTSSVSSNLRPNGLAVNYPETPSAFQKEASITVNQGFFVAFLTKLSADLHTILYSSILGGANVGGCGIGLCGNFGQALTVGQNGIAYLGGYTSSASFPVTVGAFQTACPSCYSNFIGPVQDSGFISGFDTTQSGAASLVFSTYLNGNTAPETTYVNALAADAQNNVYATGSTTARDFPTTAGSYSPGCVAPNRNNGDCDDAFVLKLSRSGSLVWSTYYGSSVAFPIGGVAIALDSANNTYIAGGGVIDIGLPQINAASPQPFGGLPVFLATFSADGSKLLFASYFGGSAVDTPSAIALDSAANIYFAGVTRSSDLPATPGAIQSTNSYPDPGTTGFFAKVSCINAPCPALPSLTVNAVNLSIAPGSAALGQLVTLMATVVGQAGQAIPTGSVVFSSTGTIIGSAPLNSSGIAIFTTASLAGGNYAVTATYSGDTLYSTSTSPSQALTVQQPPTTTSASNVPLTFSTGAQTVTLSASVTSGSGVASGGSVAFTLLGMTVSASVTNGSAAASFSVPGGTAAGPYPIQAVYSGSGNFSMSSDNSKQLTIGKATPVVTFSNPSDISQGTALGSTQLNATASVPGTFVYTPPAGTVLPAGSGQTLSVMFTPTDTADYNPVIATAAINVKAPNAVTTVTTTNNVALTFSPTAQTITLTATVSSTPAVSGGTVAFTLLGTTVSGSVTAGSASAAFTVPAGTAAGSYPIQAAYTPTGSFAASSENTKQLSIAKATPVLNFPNPADIGTDRPLGSTQLNATANVPGSFVYTPASGTVLPLRDGQTLLASFTPTDTADYNPASITALINVKPRAPTPTSIAANGISITFSPNTQTISLQALVTSSAGVPTGSVLFTLAGAQVSGVLSNGTAIASFNVFGNSPVGNYPIQAVYVPTGNFAASSDNSKQLSITKATPVVSFANPADIVAGTALGSAQLNATANVPGTFVYTPTAGTVLPPGSGQALLATFTPSDSTNYNTATGTAQINVRAAPVGPIATVTRVTTGVKIPYSASFPQQLVTLNALVSSAAGPVTGGSVKFSPFFSFPTSAPLINGSASVTLPVITSVVGYFEVSAVFVPDPTSPYVTSEDDSKYAYEVQGPINWPTPADITFGTALSSDQLNASILLCTSCVGSGSPTYSPPAGTVLPVGRQLLSVSFSGPGAFGSPPSTGNASVYINVLPAVSATPPNLVGTTILSRDPVTNEILAQFTVSNTGGTVAPNSQITSFRIGETYAANTSTPLPLSLGSIGPGASSPPITFRLPANVGPPGRATFLFVTGTYAGYGWNYSSRITLP